MKTPPAACDLEAAVPAGSAAVAAQQPPAAKVAEDPRLRSAFVRKIYGILFLQFVLTAAVAATAFFVRPVARFFADGPAAAVWPTFIVILVSPLIVMFPMLEYSEKRPRKLVLLALFTLCCSFSIAVPVFAFTTVDKAVLQVTILTALGLTLFAIWAAKRGYDDDFNRTFASLLFSIILVLPYIIVAIPFPLKMVGIAICGFLATLVLWGFVVVICYLDDKDGDDYNGGGSDEEDDI